MTEKHYRDVAAAVRRQQHKWHSLGDLADKMLARAAAGKNVVLSPGTAEVVGRAIKSKSNCD